jgi:hypothetical protein
MRLSQLVGVMIAAGLGAYLGGMPSTSRTRGQVASDEVRWSESPRLLAEIQRDLRTLLETHDHEADRAAGSSGGGEGASAGLRADDEEPKVDLESARATALDKVKASLDGGRDLLRTLRALPVHDANDRAAEEQYIEERLRQMEGMVDRIRNARAVAEVEAVMKELPGGPAAR